MIKVIEPLGKHDRAAFSCGVAALDDWFRFRAGQDEKRNLARVFVAIDDQLGVVGFHAAPLARVLARRPTGYRTLVRRRGYGGNRGASGHGTSKIR